MRYTGSNFARRVAQVGLVFCAGYLAGCGVADTRRVGYGPSQQVWSGSAGVVTAGTGGVGGFAGSSGGTGFVQAGTGVAGFAAPAGTGGFAGDTGIAGTGGVAGDMGLAGTTGGISGAGTGGISGAGAGGTGGTGLTGTMTFSVLTHPVGGNYAPANVGAIWVETSSGQFVKTLAYWAFIRGFYLSKYNAETSGNKVDAVTAATLYSHQTHTVMWNLKDASGNPAPDGAYKVIVEVTDADRTGQFTSVDFMKAAGTAPLSPPDTQFFTGMSISFQ